MSYHNYIGKPGVQRISTKFIAVQMMHLEIAEKDLREGRESVTPDAPISIDYNITTNRFSLADGYHRYLKTRGGSIASALEQAQNDIFPEINVDIRLVKFTRDNFGNKETPLSHKEIKDYTEQIFGKENRISRAKKQGFDTSKVWLHGTIPQSGKKTSDIIGFDKNLIGSNFWCDKEGFFFTDDNAEANIYASSNSIGKSVTGGSIYPVYLALKNTMLINDENAKKMGLPLPSEVGNINIWDDHNKTIMAQLNGADSVKIYDAEKKSTMMVVFEPSQIRSINSTFLPEHAKNDSLLGYELTHAITPKIKKLLPQKAQTLASEILKLANSGLFDSTTTLARGIIENSTLIYPEIEWTRELKLDFFRNNEFENINTNSSEEAAMYIDTLARQINPPQLSVETPRITPK